MSINLPKNVRFAVVLVALTFGLGMTVSYADDNNSDAKARSSQSSKSSAPAAIDSASAEKSAKVPVTDLHRALKAIGDTSNHIRRTALDIIGEVERQDLVVVSEPDMFGPIVVPAIPAPDGIMAMGDYLPPRKKWLDIWISQLDQLLPVLHDEANSAATDSKEWVDLKKLVDDAQHDLQVLKEVAGADKPDRLAVGKQALGIYDDMGKIDKERKEIFRQSGKKEAASTGN